MGAVLSRLFLFVRDLFLAKSLGPTGYGIWQRLILVLKYALHAPLGFQHAMSRDDPLSRGKGDETKLQEVHSTSFIVVIVSAFLLAIGLSLQVMRNPTKNLLHLSDVSGIVAFALLVVLQQIFQFYSIITRARKDFRRFSVGSASSAILSLIVSLLLVPRYGAVGAVLSLVFSYFSVIVFWGKHSEFSPCRLHLVKQTFFSMGKLALPMFGVGLIQLLASNVDRVIVATFLSNTELGYYSLAFMLESSIRLLVTPVVTTITPRLYETYGKTNDIEQTKRLLIKPMVWCAYGLSLLIGVLWLTIGDGTRFLLPQYINGVQAARISLLKVYVLSVPVSLGTLFLMLDKQYLVLVMNLVSVMISIALSYILVDYGINGVAVAATIGAFIKTVMSISWADYLLSGKLWGNWLMARVFLPIAYILLVVWFVQGVLPEDGFLSLRTALRLILFLMLCMPLVFGFVKNRYALVSINRKAYDTKK
jgi:O-antigen/teichoic acid export membrane protein